MTSAEFAIWNKLPAELNDVIEKATRNLLVSHLGGVINDVKTSIEGYERKAAQKAEIALAASEGREAVDLSTGKDEAKKSEEVRIGEAAIKCIKIAQAIEEPDFDATEIVKLGRAMLFVVGQTDTTVEA
jgi:hypothetical protein